MDEGFLSNLFKQFAAQQGQGGGLNYLGGSPSDQSVQAATPTQAGPGTMPMQWHPAQAPQSGGSGGGGGGMKFYSRMDFHDSNSSAVSNLTNSARAVNEAGQGLRDLFFNMAKWKVQKPQMQAETAATAANTKKLGNEDWMFQNVTKPVQARDAAKQTLVLDPTQLPESYDVTQAPPQGDAGASAIPAPKSPPVAQPGVLSVPKIPSVTAPVMGNTNINLPPKLPGDAPGATPAPPVPSAPRNEPAPFRLLSLEGNPSPVSVTPPSAPVGPTTVKVPFDKSRLLTDPFEKLPGNVQESVLAQGRTQMAEKGFKVNDAELIQLYNENQRKASAPDMSGMYPGQVQRTFGTGESAVFSPYMFQRGNGTGVTAPEAQLQMELNKEVEAHPVAEKKRLSDMGISALQSDYAALVKNPTRAGDFALLSHYLLAVNPSAKSVNPDGTINVDEALKGAPQSALAYAKKLSGGSMLTNDERKEMVDAATAASSGFQNAYNKLRQDLFAHQILPPGMSGSESNSEKTYTAAEAAKLPKGFGQFRGSDGQLYKK